MIPEFNTYDVCYTFILFPFIVSCSMIKEYIVKKYNIN